MKHKFQIGDNIDIEYNIDGEKLSDSATITFIDNGYIYTCGHCFPKNATTKYGKMVYSSGFDEPSEKEEIAIIKIDPRYLKNFRQMNIKNNFSYTIKTILPKSIVAILLFKKKFYKGEIITKIEDNLRVGWNRVKDDILIDHQITKLEAPYFLIKLTQENKELGLSGSPWIGIINNQLQLIGGHIGKTIAKRSNGEEFYVAYVKPIKKLI
jgi:hypothetical protein